MYDNNEKWYQIMAMQGGGYISGSECIVKLQICDEKNIIVMQNCDAEFISDCIVVMQGGMQSSIIYLLCLF